MSKTISYLGPRGTYCEEAARTWAETMKDFRMFPLPTLEDVMASVGQGRASLGVVPLENSLEGSVGLVLDLLAETGGIKIRGEVILDVIHYLFAPPGTGLEDLEEIHSHPQALAQCRPFILAHCPGIREVPQLSTAEAVAEVARKGGGRGALASRGSGMIYGLNMLRQAVSRESGNKTRFVVLSAGDAPPTGRDKTSLLFTVEAGPGRLYRILEIFAREEIDLCKIESRPTKKELGEYIFFVDFVGHRQDKKAAAVLEEVKKRTPFFKVLGSYPASI